MHTQVQIPGNHTFLADFGLSRIMSSTLAMGTRTLQAGTPGFQSPEQLKAKKVDQGADVYAFGVTLIELFGEKPVWDGLDHYQIIFKVCVDGLFPDFDHLPQPMQQVCSSCVSQKESRSSINEVLRALLKINTDE